MIFDYSKSNLFRLGQELVLDFCTRNELEVPKFESVHKSDWLFKPCAYYRKSTIFICVDKCSLPCNEQESRQWSWPGSTTDRTPYGVVAHELGHHADVTFSTSKGAYYGNYSQDLRVLTKEKEITSYCPNDAEWFAEIFRLFVTNPQLLSILRPNTHQELCKRLQPIDRDWRVALGSNVPQRVLRTLINKGAK